MSKRRYLLVAFCLLLFAVSHAWSFCPPLPLARQGGPIDLSQFRQPGTQLGPVVHSLYLPMMSLGQRIIRRSPCIVSSSSYSPCPDVQASSSYQQVSFGPDRDQTMHFSPSVADAWLEHASGDELREIKRHWKMRVHELAMEGNEEGREAFVRSLNHLERTMKGKGRKDSRVDAEEIEGDIGRGRKVRLVDEGKGRGRDSTKETSEHEARVESGHGKLHDDHEDNDTTMQSSPPPLPTDTRTTPPHHDISSSRQQGTHHAGNPTTSIPGPSPRVASPDSLAIATFLSGLDAQLLDLETLTITSSASSSSTDMRNPSQLYAGLISAALNAAQDAHSMTVKARRAVNYAGEKVSTAKGALLGARDDEKRARNQEREGGNERSQQAYQSEVGNSGTSMGLDGIIEEEEEQEENQKEKRIPVSYGSPVQKVRGSPITTTKRHGTSRVRRKLNFHQSGGGKTKMDTSNSMDRDIGGIDIGSGGFSGSSSGCGGLSGYMAKSRDNKDPDDVF